MSKLFVISDQTDVQALVRALLGGRIGAAKRDAAIAELRRANPGLDLDRLRPGLIVVVPDEVEAGDRAEDPVRDGIADLVSRAAAATKDLPAEADRTEERRRAEADEVRAMLGSAEVSRLVAGSPQLKRNIALVGRELEKQDIEANESRDALRRATEEWSVELDALAKLVDRD